MKPLHLAIGIFDGLHIGHRTIIGKAISQATLSHTCSGVLSFYPHPKKVLGLPQAPQMIYPIQQRYQLLKSIDLMHIFIKHFTPAWSQLPPDRFFHFLKRIFPNLHTVYVGEDFHFGYQRQGNVITLQSLCQKDQHTHLDVTPHCVYDNKRVSSSRIRNLLRDGNLPLANKLLGKPYHRCAQLEYTNDHHALVKFLYPYELPLPTGNYIVKIQTETQFFPAQITVQNNSYSLTLNRRLKPITMPVTLYFLRR